MFEKKINIEKYVSNYENLYFKRIEMKYRGIYQTKNVEKDSFGKPVRRQPKYIILHHTGNIGLKGNLNTLLGKIETNNPVSAHFLVDYNGDIYKLSDPLFNTWHEGKSSWRNQNISKESLGIEIMGPNKKGEFSEDERVSVRNLLVYLMKIFEIPKENVLRHKDIAPGRKNDVADSFWNNNYKSFQEYISSL